MATRGTPRQAFRVPPELWERFCKAADETGTERSELVRQFMAWFARDRGAKLPERPGK